MNQALRKTARVCSVLLGFVACCAIGRHPFRSPNPDFPRIAVSWMNGKDRHAIQSPYVRLHPLFTFKTEDFSQYFLPDYVAHPRNASVKIDSRTLSRLIENVLPEIQKYKKKLKRKKELTDFQILQHKNFNFKKPCGLLVLKFKKYPLVVKLFIEQPSTFLDMHATGLEPTFFFYMGGGANRHLSGFTRIKNREAIIEKLSNLDRWRNAVSVPRKWFWLPQNPKNLKLTAENLASHEIIETHIPSIYAVIADEVRVENDSTDINLKHRGHTIMQLCNDLDMFVDPHDKNYVFTKNEEGKYHITIVDTEHFPTMVGILDRKKFNNHTEWYAYLAGKCFNDMFLQTKRGLFDAQGKISALALI